MSEDVTINSIKFDFNNGQKAIAKTEKNYDNEIMLKVKIEQNDVNKNIYFLDNTQEDFNDGKGYNENGNFVIHNHDNLKELNKNNTILVIDGEIIPFKKSFIPKKSGIYSIKLIFKNKLFNCAYMFYECKNIIDIDFSKFNTENIIDMQVMIACCPLLKSLDFKSFKTENVTNMDSLFYGCESLTSLDLRSFNTKKVTNMEAMFGNCFSLKKVNLSSFNTQNVTNMEAMFYNCSSLKAINLSSFNTQKVNNMILMFYNCSSLTIINLSSFKGDKANTEKMFTGCKSLSYFGSFDKNIKDAFNKSKNI